jgi:hypothetical protein
LGAWVWIVIALAGIVVLAVGLWAVRRRGQRREMREWFGPEHDPRSHP